MIALTIPLGFGLAISRERVYLLGVSLPWPPTRPRSNRNCSPTARRRYGPGTITKLRGPAKGIFYQLYVLIDIYSRFNPSWIVSPVEDSD
jgi:hypothetical protein